MELSEIEFRILLDYWIRRRNYARDCRWTNRRLKYKVQVIYWDEHYKNYDKKVRRIRKAMKEVQ